MTVLAYDDLVIGVASDTPSHLEWLEEFLCPPFRCVPDATAGITVVLTVDRHRHRALVDDGRSSGDLDCFALDSAVVRLPVRREPGGALVVHDDPFGLFYRIDAEARRIEVVTHRDRPALRTPLMRLVRELAMNHARRRGELFLHAASVGAGDRATVLCGVKSSGKTTLLLHVLSVLETGYLGNDRVGVSFEGSRPRLRGMPSVVTVRPAMLELLPTFRAALEASGYHSRATMTEISGGLAGPPARFSDGRHGLTPLQMARLAGAERIDAATACSIAFPTVTHRPGPIRVRPLDGLLAAPRLASCAGDGSHLNHITSGLDFTAGGTADPPTWQATCERLIAELPCYEVELGNEAYADPAASRAELGKLFA